MLPNHLNSSGLYNIACGRAVLTPILLGTIGINEESYHLYPLGRFRDITINSDASIISVFTRNKHGYDHVHDALRKNPQFLEIVDHDDYLTYVFSVPTAIKISDESCKRFNLPLGSVVDPRTRLLQNMTGNCYNPLERFTQAVNDFKAGIKTPDSERLNIMAPQISGALQKSFKDRSYNRVCNQDGCVMTMPIGDQDAAIFDIDAEESIRAIAEGR